MDSWSVINNRCFELPSKKPELPPLSKSGAIWALLALKPSKRRHERTPGSGVFVPLVGPVTRRKDKPTKPKTKHWYGMTSLSVRFPRVAQKYKTRSIWLQSPEAIGGRVYAFNLTQPALSRLCSRKKSKYNQKVN